MNKTFAMLKPDCLERNLSEPILSIIQENGFVVEKKKTITVDQELILKHYQEVLQRFSSESFTQSVLTAFVGKEVIALQLSSADENTITKFRTLIGVTDPSKADPQSIRGQFKADSLEQSKAEGRMLNNLIHASDSEENAQKELELWFNKN